jgi:hypothetical protein
MRFLLKVSCSFSHRVTGVSIATGYRLDGPGSIPGLVSSEVASLRGCEPRSKGTFAIGRNVTENTGMCVVLTWEIDASQRGRKPLNTEAEEPLPGNAQRRHRRLSAFCSDVCVKPWICYS